MHLEQSAKELERFISDFKLKDNQGIVSFDSTIHIFMEEELHVFESNVQVITSNHLDAVYIVYNQENKRQFPDMFEPHTHTFTYVKNECLRIRPVTDSEKMTVSIFPRPI